MKHFNSRNIAFTAVFAALYYVMSYLPGIPAIGVPGVKVQLEACMASVFGLILGPYLGAIATFVGVLAAWALPPGSMSPHSLIFLPSPVINALVVGLIYNGKWKIASIMLAALVSAFWLLPPAQPIEQNFFVGVAAMWDKALALMLVAPVAALIRKPRVSSKKEGAKNSSKKFASWVSILVIMSAVLILVNTYLIAISGDVLKFRYDFQGETYKLTLGYRDIVKPMAAYGYLWCLIGVGILISAAMLYIRPKHNLLFGGIIIALSGVSTVIGGGFIAGFILGVVGGLLSIIKVQAQTPKALNVEFLIYFLLAFIGNEADNAWGNNIFAVPQIYEGLFGMNLEAVRWAFLISPYAYFIIRLIQAVIAASIALPLINNLRAAGLGFQAARRN